jgi:hypothetical protein
MGDFNQFATRNGASILHLDEDLQLEKELREEIVFWGSVYKGRFVEMPDEAFTSEAAYRRWCLKTAGMMPAKRSPGEFDKYIRPRIEGAKVRQVAPGSEYGAATDEIIEQLVMMRKRQMLDVDDEDDVTGQWVWKETIEKARGKEVVIKIKGIMRSISQFQSAGMTEEKITRRKVIERLLHYGRQVGDRQASVNRHRSAYALPIKFLEEGFEGLGEVVEGPGCWGWGSWGRAAE